MQPSRRFFTTLDGIRGIAAIAVVVVHDRLGWTRTNLFGGAFRVGYSFAAGVLLHQRFESQSALRFRMVRSRLLPWLILGLVAVALGARPTLAMQPYYQLAVVVLLFPGIVYTALWTEPTGIGARVCRFFGSISYAVLTLHVPLLGLFSCLIVKMNLLPIESLTPWAGFLFLGVLVPFCWAVDKFYDTPLRSFLRAQISPIRYYNPEVLAEEAQERKAA